jgi:undecaprenyl-diphosphatase
MIEVPSIMNLMHVIVLAIVQGLTEFLPVSSSAHLTVLPAIFGWEDPGLNFDIALHVGTLIAILIYFWRDWVQVIAHGLGFNYRDTQPGENSRKILWFLVVGTIPGAVFGALFNKYAENELRNFYIIGTAMIVMGIVLWLVDRLSQGKTELDSMTWTDAILIGTAQAFAIIPGVSRSGSTISMGRFRNMSREAATRFSFLLSAPIIAGSALKDVVDLRKHPLEASAQMPWLVGILVSGVVGIVVIAFFLQYLRRNTFTAFAIYRIVFGIIVIALAFFRFRG